MSSQRNNDTNNVNPYNNEPLRFTQDNVSSSSSAVASMSSSDKNHKKDSATKERNYFPSTSNCDLSEKFIGPQLPPAACLMRNGPSYPNIPPMCFPGGPMNMMDQSQMMMGPQMDFNPFWGMNPMGMMNGPRPPPTMQKPVLTFKSSTLYPPPPGSNIPSTRERPPGCRTVFVGGIPENTTEDHLREIFERSGQIFSIRVSKKNFAHIRFVFHASVEQALYISAYCMKIDNKTDKPNCGRLHVDYATARDDQYEYECQQRQWARELRHRQKMEEDRLRPPSPPQIVNYTENEAFSLQENLKCDETFNKATDILITWMERGNCNRKTVNTFYGLLQTINSNLRRLMSEKDMHEAEIRKLQENFRQRFADILSQFDQIEKVFSTACKQKTWDNFSKAQRKNIDLWFKQIQETKIAQQEEFFNEYQDDAMEMSDGENGEAEASDEAPPPKKKKSEIDVNLRDENDALKCQLEAYKNEIDMARQEALNSLEMKDKQLKAFQMALQGMQQQLIASRQSSNDSEKPSSSKESSTDPDTEKNIEKQLKEKDEEIEALKLALQGIEQNKQATGSSSQEEMSVTLTDTATNDQSNQSIQPEGQCSSSSSSSTTISNAPPLLILSQTTKNNDLIFSQQQLKLTGLISCFLNVHPMGASPDYIWSYLKQMEISVRASEIEELLEKLPTLFKMEISGCGASLERRWKFTGFPK